jgi:hypothetical protein
MCVNPKNSVSKPKNTVTSKEAKNFRSVFSALKKILAPYEKHLQVQPIKKDSYALITQKAVHKGKPIWFAWIRLGKNYVSYHLMPIYMNAAMQKRIPPDLKRRMQGKACFNFTEVDAALFQQLGDLTAAGFEGYRALNYI